MATTIKFSDNDFLKIFKYKISDVSVWLNYNDSTITEKQYIQFGNERILDFFIEENYEEYYYPIIAITMTMSNEDYELIVGNKDNVEFILNITKEYFIERNGEFINTPVMGSAAPFTSVTDMSKIKFKMVTDENIISLYEEEHALKEADGTDYRQRTLTGYLYDTDENGNLINTTDVEDDSIDESDWEPHTIYLFVDTLPKSRRTVNQVFQKATVLQAIMFIFQAMGISNVLMPKINNNKKYKEMIIPPMTCVKALSFLDTYYGIFRKGSLIFFDFDRSYLIPYSGKCDISEENEKKTTCIIIPKNLNSGNKFANKEGMICKFVKKTKKNSSIELDEDDATYNIEFAAEKETVDPLTHYIVANMATVEINDESVMLSYEGDGETSIIDPESGEMTSSLMSNMDYGQLSKYVVNKTLNPFITSMYKAKKQVSNVQLVMSLCNIDIDALKPNRLYNIIFEEKKYKKKFGKRYVLAGCRHQFIPDGDYWRLETRVVFRSFFNIKDASLPKINVSLNNGKRKKKTK